MTRIIGAPKSRRRHWTLLWCLIAVIGVGVVFIPGALAVHDTGVFQLDGDAATGTQTVTAGIPPATDDWDKVCYEKATTAYGKTAAQAAVLCGIGSPTSGATAVEWTADKLVSS